MSLFISVDQKSEEFPGWSPYNYTMNNPINLIDPTGMAPEAPDNRYRIYKKGGEIQRIEYVNDDGGDNTDYITEIDMDQPMMYANSSKSYTTDVQKYKSKVKTNLSHLNGTRAGTWRGPGYSYEFDYQSQSQAIEPMGIDSPFFIAGGVASKFLGRINTAKGSLGLADDFLSSATKQWGDQGLTVVGRALQKHAGREGSVFQGIKFSH